MTKKLFAIFVGLSMALSLFGQISTPQSWEYCDHYVFSGVDLNTNPKTFNNLLGDTWDYRIYAIQDSASSGAGYTQLLGRINGDAGANYRQYRMQGFGSAATGAVYDTNTQFGLSFVDDSTDYRGVAVLDILGASGSERALSMRRSFYYAADTYIQEIAGFWKNTSDEITSIEFRGANTTAMTGEIYIFKRRKSGVYNAADWELISDVTFTGTNLATSPQIWSNLSGDTDGTYLIEYSGTTDNATASYPRLRFNGDSGNNYTYQNISNAGGTLAGAAGTISWVPGVEWSSAGDSTVRTIIQAKSGKYRTVRQVYGGPGASDQIDIYVAWENAVDELTSITFYNSSTDAITGSAKLYKRSAKHGPPAHEKLIFDYDIGDDATVLLLHMNGTDGSTTFTDSSTGGAGSPHTITANGDAQIDTAQSVFGGASGLSDGTTDYLYVPSTSDFAFLTGDFTIDFWVRANAFSKTNTMLFELGDYNTSAGMTLQQSNSAELKVFINGGSADLTISSHTIPTGQWVHMVLTRHSGTLEIFENGVSLGSASNSESIATDDMHIMADAYNSQAESLDGWIDEFRVVKGVAVWTSDFDVPTREHGPTDVKIPGDFSAGTTLQNLDTNKMYRVSMNALADSTPSSLRTLFNGDSGSNYYYQFLQGAATSATAGSGTISNLSGCQVDTTYPGVLDYLIFPKTGKYRPVLNTRVDASSGSLHVRSFAQWWLNTTDPLRDLTFYAGDSNAMTGNIKVWEIDIPDNAKNEDLPVSLGATSYWPLEEASGNLQDVISSQDSTSTQGLTYGETGVNGSCIDIGTNSGDGFSVPDNALFDKETWSFVCWVNFDGSLSSNRWIAAKANGSKYNLLIQYNNSGATAKCELYDGSNNPSATGPASSITSAGTWYHVAVCVDGSNITVYVDGVAGTPRSNSTGATVTNDALEIGTWSVVPGETLDGKIDEISYYPKCLSSDEVNELYDRYK